jgi:hypothetical protein
MTTIVYREATGEIIDSEDEIATLRGLAPGLRVRYDESRNGAANISELPPQSAEALRLTLAAQEGE